MLQMDRYHCTADGTIEIRIAGCPAYGLPAVTYRESVGLPAAPNDCLRITIPDIDLPWLREYPDLLNSAANLDVNQWVSQKYFTPAAILAWYSENYRPLIDEARALRAAAQLEELTRKNEQIKVIQTSLRNRPLAHWIDHRVFRDRLEDREPMISVLTSRGHEDTIPIDRLHTYLADWDLLDLEDAILAKYHEQLDCWRTACEDKVARTAHVEATRDQWLRDRGHIDLADQLRAGYTCKKSIREALATWLLGLSPNTSAAWTSIPDTGDTDDRDTPTAAAWTFVQALVALDEVDQAIVIWAHDDVGDGYEGVRALIYLPWDDQTTKWLRFR